MIGLINGSQRGLLGDDYDEDLTAKSEHIQNGRQYRSSAISTVDYDGKGNMKVKYRNGNGKQYDFPCSPEEWEELKSAPSKGQYMYYNARRY